MPIPAAQLRVAQSAQSAAAHDTADRIRLIAGPGTGKSSSIEQRVAWLLGRGVGPDRIYAVSFTRASANDLAERVAGYGAANGVAGADGICVSTLHSLALRILRRAGLLNRYPADPLVLDDWELENIFDAEFGASSSINSKRRRADIRLYYEAFWYTGQYNPPNYIPANPPVTPGEANQFSHFYVPTSQVYSCVLPGEIVQQCVHEMNAGTIDPVTLLGIEHLIVDEFQDLNPVDLSFVDGLVTRGSRAFIGGDDDQSIYSFRYANPAGIQTFPARHAGTSLHTLNECFRCMPAILDAANTLIGAFPQPNRIPKNLMSLYRHTIPASAGVIHRWRFISGHREATAIAESCRDIIRAGINPKEILILVNNRSALENLIVERLTSVGVPVTDSNAVEFIETEAGRLTLAVLRVVINSDDYIAMRTILGLRNGVGVTTTFGIRKAVIDNNLNYRDVFYGPLPNGAFSARQSSALNAARAVCAQIQSWQELDTLTNRSQEIGVIIDGALGPSAGGEFMAYIAQLPQDATLRETRDFIWADGPDARAEIIGAIYNRLGQPVPTAQVPPSSVRLMTMHGSKGLSAKVVFIPGLEESLIPGPWRAPFPGLTLEAARLLYVSITRARAACILSYSTSRMVNGQWVPQRASRFASSLNGPFTQPVGGLTGPECATIMATCAAI